MVLPPPDGSVRRRPPSECSAVGPPGCRSECAADSGDDGGLLHDKAREVHAAAQELRELLAASAVRREGGHHRRIHDLAVWALQPDRRLATAQAGLSEALLALIHCAADPCCSAGDDGLVTQPAPVRTASGPPPSTPGDIVAPRGDGPAAVAAARRWLSPEERRRCAATLDHVVDEMHPSYVCAALLPLLSPPQNFLGQVVHRQHVSALLSAALARPGGVRSLADCLLTGVPESEAGAYRRVTLVVCTPPSGAPSSAVHLAAVCHQLAELWALDSSWKDRKGAPHRGHLVCSCAELLAGRHSRAASAMLLLPRLWPLFAAGGAVDPRLLRRCTPELRQRLAGALSAPEGTVLASGEQVARAAEALHRLCAPPRPGAVAAWAAHQCLPGLLRLHSAVHGGAVHFAAAVEEVLVRYFQVRPDEGRAALRALVAAGQLCRPGGSAAASAEITLPGGGALPALPAAAASPPPDVMFRPSPDGGVELRRRSAADGEDPDDQVPLCALLTALSRRGSPVPADLMMELLTDCHDREAGALPAMGLLRSICESVGASCLKTGRHAAGLVIALLRSAVPPSATRRPPSGATGRPLLELADDSPPETAEQLEQREEALALALPLLECALAGEVRLGVLPEPELRRVDALLSRCVSPTPQLQQAAAACRVGIAERLAAASRPAPLSGDAHSPPPPAQERGDALRRVFALLHDPNAAVRSGALVELRRLVLSPGGVGEHFDAAFDVFSAHLADADVGLYLPSIMGLAALADVDGGRTLPLLLARYSVPPADPSPGEQDALERAQRRRRLRQTAVADEGRIRLDAGGTAPRKGDRRQAADRARERDEDEEATLLKLADCLVYCVWRLGDALPKCGAGFVEAFASRAHHAQPATVRASALWALGFTAAQLSWAAAPRVPLLVGLAHDVLSMDTDRLCRRAAASLLQQLFCSLRRDVLQAVSPEVLASVLATARRLLHGGDPVVGECARLLLEGMNEVRCDVMLQPRRSLFSDPAGTPALPRLDR
eukprot:TRINITY_DN21367_c0_g2_i1.p1 TRINITY_DN21367_c0_g2~~TRINITY_DN21367_c0_g2_i1.p1  ORF type:complete len:1010 (+),score=192.58 TRINITY_DN21367_c0_g2_i1:74-3103(+)